MGKQLEQPFEYLRRKEDGKAFDQSIVENWYKARAYVLDKLKDIAFKPDSKEHLHVVVEGDDPLMLSVVRHVALYAHYINFDDNQSEPNRTVVTIVSDNHSLLDELEKEEYLGNLPKFCKHSVFGGAPQNINSYIDIELEIVRNWEKNNDANTVEMTKDDVLAFCNSHPHDDIYCIDTRKAVYVERIYSLGVVIDSLPAEDIHSAKRYALALDVFQYERLGSRPKPMIDNEGWKHLSTVKEKLSSIFCSDCFESRARSVALAKHHQKRSSNGDWETYNEPLSKSEHARWATEKLIMGFRPFSAEERYHDECLTVQSNGQVKKNQYRKGLKKDLRDPAHIDICSYNNLRRINPDDLKYDSFLMLAIPMILEKISKDK